jgi:tRNA(Ile)-lysidine synthase
MGPGAVVLSPESLLPLLDRLKARRLWVAFSGGLDSTSLLLALAELRVTRTLDLRAVHAHHGVHPDAAGWAQHCAVVCEGLDVPLTCVGPPGNALAPGSPEARLRHWRYAEFQSLLEPGDVLCTAHHREDQAETVLLALLRGSGPGGVAAMPEQRSLGSGRLVRPLLDWPRAALLTFVRHRDIPWIEDPANAGTDPDRNYLRHEIMPRLRERWLAADASFATSARLCGESQSALDALLDAELANRTPAPGVLHWQEPAGDAVKHRLMLRRWLGRAGCAPVPRARLVDFLAQLGTAGKDRQPLLAWADHTLQRYRDQLWLDSPDLEFPGGALTLEASGETGEHFTGSKAVSDVLTADRSPLAPALEGLSLRPRAAGDRVRLRPDGPSRPLKQWLSASPLPPWLRPALPLLCRGEVVVAVADAVVDDTLESRLEACGARLRWTPADPGLAWAWERCRASLLRVE